MAAVHAAARQLARQVQDCVTHRLISQAMRPHVALLHTVQCTASAYSMTISRSCSFTLSLVDRNVITLQAWQYNTVQHSLVDRSRVQLVTH